MRTVGQILKEAREAKLMTLDDVEKQTKIRKELLEALENNELNKLPPEIFIRGFIKNYGKLLNLDINKLMAVFRRDYEVAKHPPQILDSLTNPVANKRFRFTPSHVLGTVIGLIIISFFVYLWVEYHQFISPPTLEVTSPQDQQSVGVPTVSVSGKTDPEDIVSINDQQVPVTNTGSFQEDLNLDSTMNTITIKSVNKFGRSNTITRTVYVKR